MVEILNFFRDFLLSIMNIELPWFGLTFGKILIGNLFIIMLIGVFKTIFTSFHGEGSIKDD